MALALRSGIPYREWVAQSELDHRVVVTAFDLYRSTDSRGD